MKKLIVVLLFLSLIGCTDAEWSSIKSLGDSAEITLYGCDGKEIQKWESTGRVAATDKSDGWEFRDKATGKFIRVSGTVVIKN